MKKPPQPYGNRDYRKEVTLTEGVVYVLSQLAERSRRPLKNYMEEVLIDHAQGKAETNGKVKTNKP